ncbi:MAG: hypothetical protein QOJ53_269 [Sphingomonadales bacterium]|jgi:uncharacterized protein YciW|nr:hypothetical protein [Sphingomonadales bacterium]MEA3044262.1 hypothetical protein [Sphingomonadales bacterium]MEA3045937.1 hypothetical protein [Sphingomonadales bacterium]
MDENSALFILIMTGMILFAYLTAMWIKYRRPAPAPQDNEAGRQIETLRQENDRLHERLAVLERIATDPAERTAHAIEQLR